MAQTERAPRGWLGRYRVVTGDTMFSIAGFFRRSLTELIRANPHIKNPNLLYPGDILSVPGQIPFPCSVVLQPTEQAPTGTEGVALVHIGFQGGRAVTVAAALPPPDRWGNFDLYTAEVIVSQEVGGFGDELMSTRFERLTWATTINLPTIVELLPGSYVRILPGNSDSGVSGPALLQGSLDICLRADTCRATRLIRLRVGRRLVGRRIQRHRAPRGHRRRRP